MRGKLIDFPREVSRGIEKINLYGDMKLNLEHLKLEFADYVNWNNNIRLGYILLMVTSHQGQYNPPL